MNLRLFLLTNLQLGYISPDVSFVLDQDQVTLLNFSNGNLYFGANTVNWEKENGNLTIDGIVVTDYGGTFDPIWTKSGGWANNFSFLYADTDQEYYVGWDKAAKKIMLTPYDAVS